MELNKSSRISAFVLTLLFFTVTFFVTLFIANHLFDAKGGESATALFSMPSLDFGVVKASIGSTSLVPLVILNSIPWIIMSPWTVFLFLERDEWGLVLLVGSLVIVLSFFIYWYIFYNIYQFIQHRKEVGRRFPGGIIFLWIFFLIGGIVTTQAWVITPYASARIPVVNSEGKNINQILDSIVKENNFPPGSSIDTLHYYVSLFGSKGSLSAVNYHIFGQKAENYFVSFTDGINEEYSGDSDFKVAIFNKPLQVELDQLCAMMSGSASIKFKWVNKFSLLCYSYDPKVRYDTYYDKTTEYYWDDILFLGFLDNNKSILMYSGPLKYMGEVRNGPKKLPPFVGYYTGYSNAMLTEDIASFRKMLGLNIPGSL